MFVMVNFAHFEEVELIVDAVIIPRQIGGTTDIDRYVEPCQQPQSLNDQLTDVFGDQIRSLEIDHGQLPDFALTHGKR
jgi:hypothetical protein